MQLVLVTALSESFLFLPFTMTVNPDLSTKVGPLTETELLASVTVVTWKFYPCKLSRGLLT